MCDYGEYDGDPVHDMWVDYSYEIGTGEDVTGEDVTGEDVTDYDDGCYQEQPTSYVVAPSHEEKAQSEIETYRSHISSDKARLLQIEMEIERIESQLKKGNLSHKRIARLQHSLADQREKYATCAEMLRIHEDKLKTALIEADIKAVESDNDAVMGCCIVVLLLAFILFWCIY